MRPPVALSLAVGLLLLWGCDSGTLAPSAESDPQALGSGAAHVTDFEYSKNMHPMGYSPRVIPLSGPGSGRNNSDLAFWGRYAFHGHYDGFRIIDISAPANPREIINYEDCVGDQGDVLVWEHILVRSWDRSAPAGATCGGLPVPEGEQGLHVFDISIPANPQVIAFVPTPCGSHTATAVPDPANDRLLVYSSASVNLSHCRSFDIVEVPLADPAAASYLGRINPEGGSRPCHDIGVILGDVNLAACAGGGGFTVWSLDPAEGGSLEEPAFLYSQSVPGVSIGHSAAFTWDGEVLVFGHEPGGGGQARCQETSDEVDRTLFFFDPRTGVELGRFLHPRPQTATENCTWHNFNVVPTPHRYVLVSGNYQSGTSVVDFTDPAGAREIAFADPAPLSEETLIAGGDWSSYWYNGFIFESDIKRGLFVWQLSDAAVAGARRLDHLNPQTQAFSLP